LWDWIFGTLFIPEHERRMRLGIGKEGREFNSVARLYALPFVRVARNIGQRLNVLQSSPPPA
jgi:hypothetical protein